MAVFAWLTAISWADGQNRNCIDNLPCLAIEYCFLSYHLAYVLHEKNFALKNCVVKRPKAKKILDGSTQIRFQLELSSREILHLKIAIFIYESTVLKFFDVSAFRSWPKIYLGYLTYYHSLVLKVGRGS